MYAEDTDCCRLCSSNNNLISIFSGKARITRDFLRKMIADTVQVQIDQPDSLTSVCINCCIDVSNFYFFKLNTLQNEENLKAAEFPLRKAKKMKLQILNVRDIQCPDFEATEKVISWLTQKRETSTKESQTLISKYANSSVQCDIPSKKSVKTQYCQTKNVVPVSKKFTQTNNILQNNTFTKEPQKKAMKTHGTQTKDTLNNKSIRTSSQVKMCQSDNTKGVNSFAQANMKSFRKDSSSQTNTPELTEQPTQCDIITPNNQKNSITVKVQSTQTNNQIVHKKGTQTNYINSKTNHFTRHSNLHLNETSLLSSSNGFNLTTQETQTKAVAQSTKITQCNAVEFAGTIITEKETFLISSSSCPYSRQVDSKLNIKLSFPDKIEEVKEEKLSPTDCLSINTSYSPKKYENNSPESSGLLQINQTKAHSVKICKLCDKTLYNRKEIMMHNKLHMQCNLCKRKFRSLKATQEHNQECNVKKVTNMTPYVDVVQIDTDKDLQVLYPVAFQQLSDLLNVQP